MPRALLQVGSAGDRALRDNVGAGGVKADPSIPSTAFRGLKWGRGVIRIAGQSPALLGRAGFWERTSVGSCRTERPGAAGVGRPALAG